MHTSPADGESLRGAGVALPPQSVACHEECQLLLFPVIAGKMGQDQARRESMNVSLTTELEALVQDKVRSGMYHSASEVVREALRLLKERDDLRRLRLEGLREEVAVGLRQAERGEVAPLDIKAVKAKARSRRKARR